MRAEEEDAAHTMCLVVVDGGICCYPVLLREKEEEGEGERERERERERVEDIEGGKT